MVAEISVDEKVLDDLLTDLQALKQNGCGLKDSRQIWCLDWLWMKENTSVDSSEAAQKSKIALSRMKAVRKMMEVLTSSLESAIQDVTDQASEVLREGGFSSLPDDVLARVFELCYVNPRYRDARYPNDKPVMESFCSSSILASVCKRFRRVALHIPCLWEEVWNGFGEEWLSCLKGRCERPKIFIERIYGFSGDTAHFFQRIHPTNYWESLHIHYDDDACGLAILNALPTASHEDFKNLRTLFIHRDPTQFIVEEDEEEGQLGTRLSRESNDLLANWSLPSVTTLELCNIIPRKMDCSSLKDLTIDLDKEELFVWDIGALKELLSWLTTIESLTLKLCRVRAPATNPQLQNVSRSARLLFLTSLRLEIKFSTEPSLLERIMDMIDAPNTSKISLCMRFDSDKDNIDARKWVDSLFESSNGTIRIFPNVTALELVADDVKAYALPFYTVLRALPGVRNLSMDISCGVLAPMLKYISEEPGCLRDFRSLYIKNCTGWNNNDVNNIEEYFTNLQERGDLGRIERLELEGCEKFAPKRPVFERLLGERFFWKD